MVSPGNQHCANYIGTLSFRLAANRHAAGPCCGAVAVGRRAPAAVDRSHTCAQQQTRRTPLLQSIDETDRWTLNRFIVCGQCQLGIAVPGSRIPARNPESRNPGRMFNPEIPGLSGPSIQGFRD